MKMSSGTNIIKSDLYKIPFYFILENFNQQKGRYLRQQQYVLQRIISGDIKETETPRVWWRLMQIIK